MLRWSKIMPRLQVQCKRSPSDEFKDVKLGAGPDNICSKETNQTIGRHKNPEKEARDAKIREMFANGETQKAIGKDYHLKQSSISIICKGVERKVKPTRAKNPEIEKRNARIKERFVNGETQKAIGKDFDLTRQAVSLICKGVERKVKPTRAKNPKKGARNARIRERFANGEIVKKIAKKERLSKERVYQICRGVVRKVKPKEERNARIRERFAKGETQKTIGKDYHLKQSSISIICKGVERKAGRKVRSRLKPEEMEKRNARITERFANGEIVKKIAKKERLSKDRVYQICKGVRPRRLSSL